MLRDGQQARRLRPNLRLADFALGGAGTTLYIWCRGRTVSVLEGAVFFCLPGIWKFGAKD